MRVSYYPGCSLRGTARDYAASVEAVCGLLDIELCELEDWNCCGATAAHSLNRRVSVDLAGRNLAIAEAARIPDLVAPCPLCFNRLKTAEHELTGGRRDAYRVSMAGDRVTVWDLANFLAGENLLDRMEARIQQDLTGLKAVCYYGCMASRPPDITGERLYENPMSMDRVLERLGVEAIQWSYKTDCCGAGHLVARPDIVFALVGKLYESARRAGADCMVVSAPGQDTQGDGRALPSARALFHGVDGSGPGSQRGAQVAEAPHGGPFSPDRGEMQFWRMMEGATKNPARRSHNQRYHHRAHRGHREKQE